MNSHIWNPKHEQRHSYDYYIDEHGDWFCQGNPVLDPQLFRYYELTRHLQMACDDRSFFFMIGGKRYDIRPE